MSVNLKQSKAVTTLGVTGASGGGFPAEMGTGYFELLLDKFLAFTDNGGTTDLEKYCNAGWQH